MEVKSASTSRTSDAQSDLTTTQTMTYRVCGIAEPPDGSSGEIEGLFEKLSLDSESHSLISERDRSSGNAKILDGSQTVTPHLTDDVVEQMLDNDSLRKVSALSASEMELNCCKSIFESLAVASAGQLCRETLQCDKAWREARELRISGSRIYGIYTYTKNKSPDWEQKSKKFFWPNKFTNIYVRHGIAHEKLARETYENKANVKVVQCGFIVHPDHRWIGYSPDGLIFGNCGAEKLIEIKCVYAGKYKPIADCLSACQFLDKSGGIRKKHTYYGQIQLGMLLCNVKMCDFIVFASFDKSTHVITVPFDEEFALEMFTVVQKAYLKEMLHYICLRKEEVDTV